MYQGKPKPFNKISDFMDRYHRAPTDKGARPSSEYRPALRNAARIAYRIAKRTVEQMAKDNVKT